jgi:ribulose-bisphosphate carboxylase small chain
MRWGQALLLINQVHNYLENTKMSDVQDYNSSLSDPAVSRKYETFSYLPALSPESIRAQIQYIVDKGWNPGIDTILAEVEACHKAHPDNHVRLLGFDNFAQSAGAAMVIHRGVSV